MQIKCIQTIKRLTLLDCFIFDVDGVLTDGRVLLPNGFQWFHVRDGTAIQMLVMLGYRVMFLTGRKTQAVHERARELGGVQVYDGVYLKGKKIAALKQALKIKKQKICYIGDDLLDIPAFEEVGFSIAVQDAAADVKKHADAVTDLCGGYGAVREAVEYILRRQKKWHDAYVRFISGEHKKQVHSR